MKKQTNNQEKLKDVIIANLSTRTYDTNILKAMQLMSICYSREFEETKKKIAKINKANGKKK